MANVMGTRGGGFRTTTQKQTINQSINQSSSSGFVVVAPIDDVTTTSDKMSTTFIAANTSKNQYPVSAPNPSIGAALASAPSSGFAPLGGCHPNIGAPLTALARGRAF